MNGEISVVLATGDEVLQPVVAELSGIVVSALVYLPEQVVEVVAETNPAVLILTDYMDPEMENVRLLRHRHPGTRVIYIITGDEEEIARGKLIKLGIYDFLPHSFRKSQLHQLLLHPRSWQDLCAAGLLLEDLISEPSPEERKAEADKNTGGKDRLRGETVGAGAGAAKKEGLLRRFLPWAAPAVSAHSGASPSSGTHASEASAPLGTRASEASAPLGTRASEVSTPSGAHAFGKSAPSGPHASGESASSGAHASETASLAGTQLPQGSPSGSPAFQKNPPSCPTGSPIRTEPTTAAPEIRVVRQQVVAFWSGKPGVGKTFTAVNTALTLAAAGVKVALVDGDIQNLSAGLMLNLQDVRKTLERALKAGRSEEIKDLLLYHPHYPNLAVLTGSELCRPEGYYVVEKEAVVSLLDYLKEEHDVVVIDTCTDIQTVTTFAALHQATRVYMLANQDYAQVFAAKRQLALLKRLRIPQEKFRLLLNGEQKECSLTPEMLEKMLGLKVNVVFPSQPKLVFDSIFECKPVALQKGQESQEMRQGFQTLAREIFPVSGSAKVSFLQNVSRVFGGKGSISYG